MRNIYIRTAGAIALVDDNEAFLDVLKLACPRDRPVRAFISPTEAVQPLIRANDLLRAEEGRLNALLAMEDPIGALRGALEWIRDSSRAQTIETTFIDYNTPIMNGLELLRQVVQPRFMRVLLTGQATTDEAVEAFNDGLIDMYLQKRDGLVAEVRQACERGDHRHRNLSWHRVDPVVCSAIKQPEGWAVVSELMARNNVREHLLLPSPCGYVCSSADGSIGWLQFDTEESLRGCLEVARDSGWGEMHTDRISRREATAPIELIDAHSGAGALPAIIAPVSVVSDQPWVGAAYFKL